MDAARAGSGHNPILINDEEAAFSYTQVGGPEKVSESESVCVLVRLCVGANFLVQGWLAFQGYYDEQLAKTGGSFLR